MFFFLISKNILQRVLDVFVFCKQRFSGLILNFKFLFLFNIFWFDIILISDFYFWKLIFISVFWCFILISDFDDKGLLRV